MRKKLFLNFIGALSLFLLLFCVMNTYLKPRDTILEFWNKKVPFYEVTGEPVSVTLKTFIKDDFDTLVLPKVSGNILKVYLNGELMYRVGTETSNIWNRCHVIPLDENLKLEENLLEVEIFGLYDVGIHKRPFITDYRSASIYKFVSDMFRSDLYLVALGMSLLSGIITFIFSYLLKSSNVSTAYKSFGIFLMLNSIYLLDYQFRLTSFNGTTFLWMKKLFLISVYVGLVFYLSGIEVYKTKEFTSKWSLFYIFPMILIIILSFDFKTYVQISSFTNLMILPLIVYLLLRVIYLKLHKLYFSAFFMFFAIVQTVSALFYSINQEFMIGYGFIVVSIGLIIKLSQDFKGIVIENYELSQKSITDPLTKAFNRYIIKDLKPEGYFILIDLDDFKKFNDMYGHEKGDKLLFNYAQVVKNKIRKSDIFIRLGGDEFAIVTNTTSPDEFIERIRKEVNKALNIDFSYGIVPFDEFSKAYVRADEKLYEMKKEKMGKDVI
ncbi:MAG: GGDEF domain-containing protein [Thermosipho sp. (in: Bacteria)]|nr:GGDEF domain-containing protein [Thermosipho sp. (in: thermotogales)]